MNVNCKAEPCPVILNSTCVYYAGANLVYTGVNTNDSLQLVIQKIDAKFKDAGLGYVFENGITQAVPGDPVMLGGSLTQNTSINSNGFTFALSGTFESQAFITTGGTSSQFVKGDGSLDSTSYQPSGNYITALTGDGTASGPGTSVFTLSNSGVIASTYGSASQVPVITVDSKGRITNVTNTAISYPAALLLFSGDVTGAGLTGANVTLTLNTVNSGIFNSITPLKFSVNEKGLVTGAAALTNLDVFALIGYTPVPQTRTITINGVTQNLSANRSWTVDTLPSQTGNAGKFLTTNGLIASWSNLPPSGVSNVTATSPITSSGGATPNISTSMNTNRLIGRGSAGVGVMEEITLGAGLSLSGNTLSATAVVTPAALTKTDDINVTLTLGGSPNTALLAATSLTLGWTGTLADSRITSAATWNAKQDAITLTTLGTSGPATFIANTLNIPQYTDQFTGTVTSVGLSMPSAFNVANSPVTSSGTLTVTGAGLASQYIRGDGSLANFPAPTGGGSSVSYFLNGSVNQGTFGGNTYYQMSRIANTGPAVNFSIGVDGYVANFITDAGDPALLSIPAGNWDFQIYFSASSSGGSPRFYTELYKYDGVNFTLISSGATAPQNITNGTFADVYSSTLTVPATTLTLTDRLAVRIYIIHSGRTITMYTQDNRLAEVHTTFSTGLAALNSLTAQVQYFAVGSTGTDFNISSVTDTHTFNLPVASATNTGKLSSTDWSTFNDKLNGYYQNTTPTGTIPLESIWVHSDTGIQYIYINDGNSNQWVQSTLPLGPQGPQGANGTNTVNSLTATTFNGLLKGNGATVSATDVLTELGYTPENVANKEDVTLDSSSTKYPTNNLVKTNLDSFADDVDYAIMVNQRILFNF